MPTFDVQIQFFKLKGNCNLILNEKSKINVFKNKFTVFEQKTRKFLLENQKRKKLPF